MSFKHKYVTNVLNKSPYLTMGIYKWCKRADAVYPTPTLLFKATPSDLTAKVLGYILGILEQNKAPDDARVLIPVGKLSDDFRLKDGDIRRACIVLVEEGLIELSRYMDEPDKLWKNAVAVVKWDNLHERLTAVHGVMKFSRNYPETFDKKRLTKGKK